MVRLTYGLLSPRALHYIPVARRDPGVLSRRKGMLHILLLLNMNTQNTPLALKCDLREDRAVKERLIRYGTHPVEYEEGLAVARRIRASRYLGQSNGQNIALPVLLEHARRWRKIDFTLADLDQKIWDALGKASPSLLEDAEIKVPVTLQQSQLNALSRMHPGTLAPINDAVVALPNIISVAGGHPQPKHFVNGLFGCCSFQGWYIDSSTLPVVRLPFLISFDICIYTDSHTVPQLFEALTLPSLTKLTITIPIGSATIPAWPRTQYLSFIARSKASLATLILEKVSISEDDVITCLEQSQQTLTRLSISGGVVRNVGDKLLQRLTIEAPTPPDAAGEDVGVGLGLCPHLESIQFMDGCLWSSDGLLGEMVRSRFHPDNIFRHGLWQLSVDFTISVDQEHAVDKEILVQLAEEGLSMRFNDISARRLVIGWVE
ncbi:Rho GTPase [Salix suchowensis]|nr:Rho GTPase [Salix suchowensis]